MLEKYVENRHSTHLQMNKPNMNRLLQKINNAPDRVHVLRATEAEYKVTCICY